MTLKQTIYFLTLAVGLISCNNTTNDHSDTKSGDSSGSNLQRVTSNSLISIEKQSLITEKEHIAADDTEVYFSDSLFANLELNLKTISNNNYNYFEKKFETTCTLDTNGFIKGKGLVFSQYCKDICESYLIDKNAGVKLVLPSSYDGGIIGLLLSPSCNQFIVYSSYNRPDYTEYYDYRAEIFGFSITQGKGFKTIKPSLKYFTKDWSIDHLTWIDDNNLALRLYSGESFGNREHLKYYYFQTSLQAR